MCKQKKTSVGNIFSRRRAPAAKISRQYKKGLYKAAKLWYIVEVYGLARANKGLARFAGYRGFMPQLHRPQAEFAPVKKKGETP